MGVYLWTNEWLPGENTVAYYPLNSTTTVNDKSGNNRNLTASGITAGTYAGVDCSLINGLGSCSIASTTFDAITLNCRFYMNAKAEHYCLLMGFKVGNNITDTKNSFIMGDFDGRPTNGFGLQYSNINGDNQVGVGNGTPGSMGTRYNGCITWDGSTIKVYLNGTLQNSASWSTKLARDVIMIGWNSANTNVYLSNAIFEKVAWSADYVANYYNTLKSKYGIS